LETEPSLAGPGERFLFLRGESGIERAPVDFGDLLRTLQFTRS
jgi:hypothetical protein